MKDEKTIYQQLIEDLKCTFCLTTLVQPMITNCVHLFCNKCIMQYLMSKRYDCPVCKSYIDPKTTQPAPKPIANILIKLNKIKEDPNHPYNKCKNSLYSTEIVTIEDEIKENKKTKSVLSQKSTASQSSHLIQPARFTSSTAAQLNTSQPARFNLRNLRNRQVSFDSLNANQVNSRLNVATSASIDATIESVLRNFASPVAKDNPLNCPRPLTNSSNAIQTNSTATSGVTPRTNAATISSIHLAAGMMTSSPNISNSDNVSSNRNLANSNVQITLNGLPVNTNGSNNFQALFSLTKGNLSFNSTTPIAREIRVSNNKRTVSSVDNSSSNANKKKSYSVNRQIIKKSINILSPVLKSNVTTNLSNTSTPVCIQTRQLYTAVSTRSASSTQSRVRFSSINQATSCSNNLPYVSPLSSTTRGFYVGSPHISPLPKLGIKNAINSLAATAERNSAFETEMSLAQQMLPFDSGQVKPASKKE